MKPFLLSNVVAFSTLNLLDASSVKLDVKWLNNSHNDPLAVCNDGSPSAYYIKEATNSKYQDLWLFYLSVIYEYIFILRNIFQARWWSML
jgi:long-subunit fatty acid transport protein